MRRLATVVVIAILLAPNAGARAESPGYTQPSHALVMPFDATEGRVSFLYVSRVDDGEEDIAVHLAFWDDAGTLRASEVRCVEPHLTLVIDPSSVQDRGEAVLRGARGFATATAYSGAEECGTDDGPALDEALAGGFTLADLESGAAFGHDALGFARSTDGSHVDLPVERDARVASELVLQAFRPEDLDLSVVILLGLRENGGTTRFPGELGPLVDVRGGSVAISSFGTELPLRDVSFSGALFATLDEAGFGPNAARVPSASLLAFRDLAEAGRRIDGEAGEGNTRVYGLLGQSIGAFGTSTRLRARPAAIGGGILPQPAATPTPPGVVATATPRIGTSPTPSPAASQTPNPAASPTPPAGPTPTVGASPTPSAPFAPPPPVPTISATPSQPVPTPAPPTPGPTASSAPPTPISAGYACEGGRMSLEFVLASPSALLGGHVSVQHPPVLSIPGTLDSGALPQRAVWTGLLGTALRAASDLEGSLRLAFAEPATAAAEVAVRVQFDCSADVFPDGLTCQVDAVGSDGTPVDTECEVR